MSDERYIKKSELADILGLSTDAVIYNLKRMHNGTFYDNMLYAGGEKRTSKYWTKRQYDMIKDFWDGEPQNMFAKIKDLDELKKKFREEAKKHHPDLYQNPIERDRHTQIFVKIKQQYEERIRELSEEAKRTENDAQRKIKMERMAVFAVDYLKEFYPLAYEVIARYYSDKKFVLNIVKTFFPKLQGIADILDIALTRKQ